jgi:hypothetical protein
MKFMWVRRWVPPKEEEDGVEEEGGKREGWGSERDVMAIEV